MKTRIGGIILLFLTVLAISWISTGCAGRLITPVYGDVPPGSTNPPPIVAWLPNTNALGAVNAVGQVGQAVPPPGNWIISGAAALFAAGLGAYARMKTNQATKAQDILNAVITGVEAVSKSTPIPAVKASISTHVNAVGYGDEFNKNVQTVSNQL